MSELSSEKIVTEVETKLVELLPIVDSLAVYDAPSYEAAAAFLVVARQRRKEIDAAFEPSITAAYSAHKKIVALKRQATEKLDTFESTVKKRMVDFQISQRRIAQAKEEELKATLKSRAEDEQLAVAMELDNAGETEQAHEILSQEVSIPSIVVAPEIPKSEGISMRKVWKFRVDDPEAVPRDFLCLDEKKLGAYARAMKEMAKVPGVTFYSEDSVAVRS